MILNGNKVFEDNATRPDLIIFRRIRKTHRTNVAHSIGYDMVSTIKKAIKNKSEADISEFISFIVDEWKDAKREEELENNRKSK